MKNVFTTEKLHSVKEANINFYTAPFVHPKRKMIDHDFIYLLQGGWKLGQNEKIYTLKKDSLIILSAGNTHYGAEACTPATKTMYFHVSREEGISPLIAKVRRKTESPPLSTLLKTSRLKNFFPK